MEKTLLLRSSSIGYTCLYGSHIQENYPSHLIPLLYTFQEILERYYHIRVPWRIICSNSKYLHIFDTFVQKQKEINHSRL